VSTGWEYADLGEFLILDTVVDRPAGGIEVECVDLAYRVDQVVADSDRRVDAFTPVASQIQALVREAIGVTVTIARDDSNGADPDDATDADYKVGTSLWEICKDLAAFVGCGVMFNRSGQLELRLLEPTTAPVVETLNPGERGVISSMRSMVSRKEFVNEFVVEMFDQADPPNRGFGRARITTGPLRWDGPVGLIRGGETLGGLLSVANNAAQNRAERELAKLSRRVREIELTLAPMPYLEAGDQVRVIFPTMGSEEGRVQTVTHGLSVDTATTAVVRWAPGTGIAPMLLGGGGFLGGES